MFWQSVIRYSSGCAILGSKNAMEKWTVRLLVMVLHFWNCQEWKWLHFQWLVIHLCGKKHSLVPRIVFNQGKTVCILAIPVFWYHITIYSWSVLCCQSKLSGEFTKFGREVTGLENLLSWLMWCHIRRSAMPLYTRHLSHLSSSSLSCTLLPLEDSNHGALLFLQWAAIYNL